jgi:2-iminobutanoate/2-iminopropanoate deaminase
MKQSISTKNAPQAIGPYSQAVIHNEQIFCSGQISLDPDTMQIVGTTVEEQTMQVLENLKAVLKAAGSSPDNALKCTIYLKNMDDFATVNEVYGKYFSDNPPARACVEVSRLPKDVLVEIDCVACL